MKTKSLLFFLAALFSAASMFATEAIVAGPKGGRLLGHAAPRAEFFVTHERKVEITFYDAKLEPASPGTVVVAVTAELKSGRTKIDLEKTDTGYVSKTPLPESAEPYRIVVQLREKPGAAPSNYRVDLNLSACGECDRAEYACTCGH